LSRRVADHQDVIGDICGNYGTCTDKGIMAYVVLPQMIVALAPILAPRLTMVLRILSILYISDRGLQTLVKTIDTPEKT
jgi:hypothetical protein